MEKTYKKTIGLEIHAQLSSQSKLFSSSVAIGVGSPNENVNFFDIGIPGTLPRLNEECLKLAIKAGKALNCEINRKSVFDRKHYTYPDLPLGFQITQFYEPIAKEGYVDVETSNGKKRIGINRIHMECDAGKMIHEGNLSLLDFNRAGVGLIEIVSHAHMNSAEEAAAYVKEVILSLKYCGACDCNMELGNLRIDVNLSVSSTEKWGTRVELKNLNSISYMVDAIEIEAKRQIDLLERGETFVPQTRSYDNIEKKTKFLRTKEESTDYRYFPDYNIPVLELSEEYIDAIKLGIRPLDVRKKYKEILDKETLSVLINDKKLVEYFDSINSRFTNSVTQKQVANLITCDLMGIANKAGCYLYESKITTDFMYNIGLALESNKISMKTAKYLISKSFETGLDPLHIIKEENLAQITDVNEINVYIDNLSRDYPEECRDLNIKPKLLMFLVGKVVSMTNGRVDPQLVSSLINKRFL